MKTFYCYLDDQGKTVVVDKRPDDFKKLKKNQVVFCGSERGAMLVYQAKLKLEEKWDQ